MTLERQRKRPRWIDSPKSSLRPRSTASLTQRKWPRPRKPSPRLLPQSNSHERGFGGGDQSRSVMSQRVNDVLSITQRMLPEGLWKKVAAEAGAATASAASRAANWHELAHSFAL